MNPDSSQRESVLTRIAPAGFDAVLVTANSDELAAFLAHLKAAAPFAYPRGVEPEPAAQSHRGLAFDGEMSRAAFARLNAAIGSRTIPLQMQEFPLEEVVEAHRRIEKGHVVGKIVLRVR